MPSRHSIHDVILDGVEGLTVSATVPCISASCYAVAFAESLYPASLSGFSRHRLHVTTLQGASCIPEDTQQTPMALHTPDVSSHHQSSSQRTSAWMGRHRYGLSTGVCSKSSHRPEDSSQCSPARAVNPSPCPESMRTSLSRPMRRQGVLPNAQAAAV